MAINETILELSVDCWYSAPFSNAGMNRNQWPLGVFLLQNRKHFPIEKKKEDNWNLLHFHASTHDTEDKLSVTYFTNCDL